MRLTAIGGSIRRLIGSRVAGAGESASLSLSFTTAHDLSLPPPHRHGDISTARTPDHCDRNNSDSEARSGSHVLQDFAAFAVALWMAATQGTG